MTERGIERAVKEPAHESERKDIATFQHRLVVKPRVGESRLCHRCHGYFKYLGVDVQLLEGVIGSKERLLRGQLP